MQSADGVRYMWGLDYLVLTPEPAAAEASAGRPVSERGAVSGEATGDKKHKKPQKKAHK